MNLMRVLKSVSYGTAANSTRGLIISLTSFSLKVAIPFSIFFSSNGVSSVVISTAVDKSLNDKPLLFFASFLSMNDVEFTNILLNGLKITIRILSTFAIDMASAFGRFVA